LTVDVGFIKFLTPLAAAGQAPDQGLSCRHPQSGIGTVRIVRPFHLDQQPPVFFPELGVFEPQQFIGIDGNPLSLWG